MNFSYELSGRRNSGEFYFGTLSFILGNQDDPKLYHSATPEEEKAWLKQCSIIDSHPNTGDFKMAFLHIDSALSPPKVPDEVYFYNRGDYYRMSLDLPGYLEEGIKLKFVNNWQYFFCDWSSISERDRTYYHDDLRQTLDDFAVLFPDEDFSRYRGILEEKMH